MATEAREQMRCPTCGAEQVWGDSCRRCRCDLRLLRAAEQAYRRHRRRCLDGLQSGQIEMAREDAQKTYRLRPAGGSCRLVAVCNLLSERWFEAFQLAKRADALPPTRAE
jgi:hypothetical protein